MTSGIPSKILEKVGRNLHNCKGHPLCLTKEHVYKFFGESFTRLDHLPPKVTVEENFDSLLIPSDHPSRSKGDTFYFDDGKHVLRTHTSAHQVALLKQGLTSFLVCADVYRKDEVDKTHYPVFHQIEGVHILKDPSTTKEAALANLKDTLSGLVRHLFGSDCHFEFKADYFPFTDPSLEVEIDKMEVLGCSLIHPDIMKSCGLANHKAWAFGLGLERLAMHLFAIPDIRLFWSRDERFLSQFAKSPVKYQPFSTLPAVTHDISCWIKDGFVEHDFLQAVRDSSNDLVESVKLFDRFEHATKGISLAYRITYSSRDSTLCNPAQFAEQVLSTHQQVRHAITERFPCLALR